MTQTAHTRAAARRRRMILTGALVIAATLIFSALDFSNTLHDIHFGGDGTRTVAASFADAKQLHRGDPVRIQGASVGKVDKIVLGPDERRAIVRMRVDKSAGPIYADARAQVRWRLLLGGQFVVGLDRGHARAGELGDKTIPVRATTSQVELEDITSAISGGARSGLQTLPRELGTALSDPSLPARTLKAFAGIAPDAKLALDGVRGQQPDEDLKRLVATAARTVNALDTPDDELRRVVAGAAATLGAVADRRDDVRQTLALAPGVMADTDTTLERLTTTLRVADPLIATLQEPAGDVAPTVAALRPTVVTTDKLAQDARPLLRALQPASASLAAAARSGLPLLNELDPSLVRLDETILPYLGEKDKETGLSAAELIGPTLGGLGSGAAGQLDQNGRFIRFPATSGSSPVYLPCQIYVANPDKAKLVECQSLQQAFDSVLSYLPPPRGAKHPTRSK
jgi:phospholipid/cholesterol/gamma-HCH transport system substrate-binding protein